MNERTPGQELCLSMSTVAGMGLGICGSIAAIHFFAPAGAIQGCIVTGVPMTTGAAFFGCGRLGIATIDYCASSAPVPREMSNEDQTAEIQSNTSYP